MTITNIDMLSHKRAQGVVINEGVTIQSKKAKKEPQKEGKSKDKKPICEVTEHNSDSEGESFDS